MRHLKVALVVGVLGLTDARLIASQMVIAQPVAAAVVTSSNPAPNRDQEQRPVPMKRQDMRDTQGNGFWSWLGDVAREAAIAFLAGAIVGFCIASDLNCVDWLPAM